MRNVQQETALPVKKTQGKGICRNAFLVVAVDDDVGHDPCVAQLFLQTTRAEQREEGKASDKAGQQYGCIRSSDEWAAGQGEPRESRFDRKRRNRPATRAGKGLEATPALMHACRTQTTAGPERDSRTVDRSMPGRPLFEKSSQLTGPGRRPPARQQAAAGQGVWAREGRGVLESGGRAEVGWTERTRRTASNRQSNSIRRRKRWLNNSTRKTPPVTAAAAAAAADHSPADHTTRPRCDLGPRNSRHAAAPRTAP